MSGNSFGEIFRITTFGESHGAALGVVIDGVPAGLTLDETQIVRELARRRPGQSAATTPRKESDVPEILSGVFKGKTTGTPLAILIRNENAQSADYEEIAHCFRPGHADYTYFQKYGFRDYRGGGRASGRETAARVAAGAVAKQLLSRFGITLCAYAKEIAGVKAPFENEAEIENNPLRVPSAAAAKKIMAELEKIRRANDSAGGIVECRISGVPAGWGEPVFDKLDALLAHAMLSLGAVKGIEFGDGFAAAKRRGSENNDAMKPGKDPFVTNHAGGVLGGISNGNEILFRVAVKPTPSIGIPQQTLDEAGNPLTITIGGRHDLCIVPRIVPVVEAMAAIVLVDLALRRQSARWESL